MDLLEACLARYAWTVWPFPRITAARVEISIHRSLHVLRNVKALSCRLDIFFRIDLMGHNQANAGLYGNNAELLLERRSQYGGVVVGILTLLV